jgi:hypothetical protein
MYRVSYFKGRLLKPAPVSLANFVFWSRWSRWSRWSDRVIGVMKEKFNIKAVNVCEQKLFFLCGTRSFLIVTWPCHEPVESSPNPLSYFRKIHFNIMLPHKPRYPRWSLLFWLSTEILCDMYFWLLLGVLHALSVCYSIWEISQYLLTCTND